MCVEVTEQRLVTYDDRVPILCSLAVTQLFFIVTGLTGDIFHFDENGDGPARYNIIHFKQVEPGVYKWIKVGEYSGNRLKLNVSGE